MNNEWYKYYEYSDFRNKNDDDLELMIAYAHRINAHIINVAKIQSDNIEIEFVKNLFSSAVLDTSHIPYVDDDEQQEIEELLLNPDCHEFKIY